jgi:hypothetical protein
VVHDPATRADASADAAAVPADAEAVPADAEAVPADAATPADPDALIVDAPGRPTRFVAVTFNTGTSENMGHDNPPDDGYGQAEAAISDQWYGDGLAWRPAVIAAHSFFAAVDADVVVFQEIFWSDECAAIPPEARTDFVCETWSPGDPTVALQVLGPGWQVACKPGKPDKCAAVNRRFGSFRGCADDFCLEGLTGFRINNCGQGSRVGRAVIDLASGGTITLVAIHGSSGIQREDQQCRVKQFEQAFVDLGDGRPAASGQLNLVMGDLNTDPGRMALLDPSAARFNDFVGPGKPFHFLTEVGLFVPPTYAGLINIDHVVGDALSGSCWIAGVTPNHPPVIDAVYFDHKPVVCTVDLPPL